MTAIRQKMICNGDRHEIINEFLRTAQKNDMAIGWSMGVVEEAARDIARFPDESDWDQFLYEFFIYYGGLIREINGMISSSSPHDEMIGHWMEKYMYEITFDAFKNMKNVSFFMSSAEHGPFAQTELRTDRLRINCGGEEKTADVRTFGDGPLDGIAFSLLDDDYCTDVINAVNNHDKAREAFITVVPAAAA